MARGDDPEVPPPLALRDLPASARKVTQQGSTFYVIGDERALLCDAYPIDALIALDDGEFAVDMTRFGAIVPDAPARDSVRA